MRILFVLITTVLIVSVAYSKKAKPDKSDAFFKKGIELLNNGDNEKAIEQFEKAHKLKPEVLDYIYEIALAYYNMKDYEKAIEILDTLRNHKDVNDQVYQLLGNSYHFIENSDKALEIYSEGLEKFPNSGRLYMEYGLALVGKKRVREVIGYWEKGIEVEPAYENNYYYLAKYFSRTGEKIWTLLYSEIYLNIAKNFKRRDEISKLLYETYNSGLFSQEDSLYKVSFSEVRILSENLENKKIPFQMAFQNTMVESTKPYILMKTTSLPVKDIIKIREQFLKNWFSKKYNEIYPNIVFEFQKKFLDSGNFEAYNYWLFDVADKKEFESWQKQNLKKFKSFLKELVKSPLKLDKNNMLLRSMYD
ncbi:MAG: tetratricopeptide repeat protein [Candidatus Kapabacteria bacterium]|nr:tetratricopeptide repeat protein [Candidatus Kapabacteria bacterium]